MTKVPEWYGVMTAEGQIFMDNPKAYAAYKQTFRDKRIVVTIRQWRPKASRKQHGWYRGYALPMIAEELGYLKSEYDAVHDAIMRELVGLKTDSDPRLKIRASSMDLNTKEFSDDLMEQLQIWAATTLGIVLNDPDPEWKYKRARLKQTA